MMLLSFSVTNNLHSAHIHCYISPSVFSSHRWIICADRCCFSAWLSSSSAWMNSNQIKLALAVSDLAAPLLPPRPPHATVPRVPHPYLSSTLLSFFWHLGSFCHLRRPVERRGAVAQEGAHQSLQPHTVYIHKGGREGIIFNHSNMSLLRREFAFCFYIQITKCLDFPYATWYGVRNLFYFSFGKLHKVYFSVIYSC